MEMFPSQQFDFPGFPVPSKSFETDQDGCSNDSFFDIASNSPSPSFGEVFTENSQLIESRKERSYTESLKILKNYQNRFRRLSAAPKRKFPAYDCVCTNVVFKKLSVAEIIKLAAEKIIQGSSQHSADESSVVSHPYASSFLGYSEEDYNDVELVMYLLASAEKIVDNQFERARKLLNECDKMSSAKGKAIERVVYYFSGALHERIDRKTGTVTPKGLGNKQSLDILDSLMDLKPDIIAMQKYVPFSQVWQFAAVQAVLDHVGDARKIHIIDMEIRTGMHYTIMMQALAAQRCVPLEYLKVTAVGTRSRGKIEETGRQLISFAESLNLKLYFDIVMVDDILDFHERLLEVKTDEAVAIYAELTFLFLVSRQDRLELLMNVIKRINPRVMVMVEVEANHNSPVFLNRFLETLFHFGAFFDCLEDCLKHDEASRMFTEGVYFSQGIRTIVAAEGEERTIRHVTMNVWKMFFARFGMVQVELSMSSVYQAKLMLNNFACGSSCTVETDGKSLIVGWKGTPIHSLSAWKVK
ncbi:hypothetical protein M9H77_36917 [Catharanthus roseus]|uniref:Uncharacterized protein n=1 Tax=Catharanthus roseus TaxID=4058 RepID=A0ACB9ZXF5_CATRO|nr:hypothetical protein M9H77_36917 [Catharanthus roseus]